MLLCEELFSYYAIASISTFISKSAICSTTGDDSDEVRLVLIVVFDPLQHFGVDFSQIAVVIQSLPNWASTGSSIHCIQISLAQFCHYQGNPYSLTILMLLLNSVDRLILLLHSSNRCA